MQMYPLCPQDPPQEFLTFQYFLESISPQPTTKTPWSRLVPQLPEQTPFLQSWNERWLAWMATEVGCWAAAPIRLASLSTVTSTQSEIIQSWSSLLYLQLPPTPLYGYLLSRVIPLSLTQKKDRFMRPPPHPLLPQVLEQSTNCCSENDERVDSLMYLAPSMLPVAEKAQHDPHWPWFLTPVTAALVTQSTSEGRLSVGACLPVH